MTFRATAKSGKKWPNPQKALKCHWSLTFLVFSQLHAPIPAAYLRLSGVAVGYFSMIPSVMGVHPDKNPKMILWCYFLAFLSDLIAFDNREHRLVLISNRYVEKIPL
jgi:hypothetical protein